MLVELHVRDLGVIDDLTLRLGPGLTALTGETGAGKTLVVEAIQLLLGGRADPTMVRAGADETWVEARFVADDDVEVVLARAVPAHGRSRAYVDGRMAPLAALAEHGERLVDLHGQHGHQSLLAPPVQRAILDGVAAVDLGPLLDARSRLRELDEELAALGGDARERARTLDLLRFQLAEIDDAVLEDPNEDEQLGREETTLADATAHRQAASAAHGALVDDGGASDAVGQALAAVGDRSPLDDLARRLRGLAAEVADVASELRARAEQLEDDPARLDAVQARRRLLADLRRKYGETVDEVLTFAAGARARADELERRDERAAALDAERQAAKRSLAAAASAVAAARRRAAPELARAVTGRLAELALPHARIDVHVGDEDPGDDVRFDFSANPGSPVLPLAKVASGGELARTMLALRLTATADGGPATVVFDEVDAGVGGQAALAVGAALATVALGRQVVVVTHLAQVAAFADAQIAVEKLVTGDRTSTTATQLDPPGRLVELSRMLSGHPDSDAARGHAEELLRTARRAGAR